ncbi:MAG: response regulator transcription factor [Bacteroidia bacterium]|nr:response regulator transcription factor [Bacteroidia bacterium]
MKKKEKIKIMMAEDHKSARQAYISMLEDEENFLVCGDAGNGMDLLKLMDKKVPDIVITDLEMPVMNGYQLLEIIKERYKEVKVIVLSMHEEEYYVSDLILRGANAYLPKRCELDDIIYTINKVHSDGYYFTRPVSKLVVSNSLGDQKFKPFYEELGLTPRELEVLKLICEEKANKNIADILEISLPTVDYHRQSIYKKTQSTSIVGLVKYAIRNGLTDLA